jgi:hypothetical protein
VEDRPKQHQSNRPVNVRKVFVKQPDGSLRETTWEEMTSSHRAVRPEPKAGPGLGDVVAGATKAVGVKPCGKCQKRREAMNQATPNYVRRVLGWLKEAPLPFTASRRASPP